MDLNQRPPRCERGALTTEPTAPDNSNAGKGGIIPACCQDSQPGGNDGVVDWSFRYGWGFWIRLGDSIPIGLALGANCSWEQRWGFSGKSGVNRGVLGICFCFFENRGNGWGVATGDGGFGEGPLRGGEDGSPHSRGHGRGNDGGGWVPASARTMGGRRDLALRGFFHGGRLAGEGDFWLWEDGSIGARRAARFLDSALLRLE